jgi:beta-galactosidase
VRITGTRFAIAFSKTTGTLTSWLVDNRELLARDEILSGPRLQVFRAPADNDRGFGRWLARDWREAGLERMMRTNEFFRARQERPFEVRIETSAATLTTNGTGYRLRTEWMVRGDGEVQMNGTFEPLGILPHLPRVGVVIGLNESLTNFQWHGRGPHENYVDRKESADVGVWSDTVAGQYVEYVRPQETGNKEDVRWLSLTDEKGAGLLVISKQNPVSVSALHFTAEDVAGARHAHELRARKDVILSIDARHSGLGNGSCGPGVLERYSVPPAAYELHLQFLPLESPR